jgi:hypothetical protein
MWVLHLLLFFFFKKKKILGTLEVLVKTYSSLLLCGNHDAMFVLDQGFVGYDCQSA